MPAALDVNREAVKMLAMEVGVREAARRMGLPESTVQAWSNRGDWFAPVKLPPTVLTATNATKQPSVALAEALADDSIATKSGFSKAARRVAAHLGGQDAEKLLERDLAASGAQWSGIAKTVHGWDAKSGADGVNVMVNVAILGA